MARNKSKTDQAKMAFHRLLNDDQAQKQLRAGTSKLRDAAGSFTSAGQRLRRKPEPPKGRGRLLAVAAVAVGAIFALKKKRGGEEQFSVEPITPPAVVTEPPKTVTPVPAA
ncbi:MAG: hypothetical protein QOJ29_490 [Thermoleophilaceae bacterium]|jgi:hypothetical protein|nr:hypothetical protein [Thermoleophilaceae bacterium]